MGKRLTTLHILGENGPLVEKDETTVCLIDDLEWTRDTLHPKERGDGEVGRRCSGLHRVTPVTIMTIRTGKFPCSG